MEAIGNYKRENVRGQDRVLAKYVCTNEIWTLARFIAFRMKRKCVILYKQ
jgi:hypothetical protein